MQNKEISYLTQSEYRNLDRLSKSDRDQLIIEILYTTGCTVNELINIRVDDLSVSERTVKIRAKQARNHETRISLLSKGLCANIKTFLESEHPGVQSSDYLLATRQSLRMTTKRVRQIVQQLTKHAHIRNKNNPQILRYTHIVHAFEKGVPIPSIQKQVGIKRSRAIQIFNELKSEVDNKAYQSFLE